MSERKRSAEYGMVSAFWRESAAELHQHCEENQGNLLAPYEFLDANPVARLELEDTFSVGGNVFVEVENEGGGSFPFHIGRLWGKMMFLFHDAQGVYGILTLAKELYGSPGHTATVGLRELVRWAEVKIEKIAAGEPIAEAHRATAMLALTAYLQGIVDAIPSMDEGGDFVSMEDVEPRVQRLNPKNWLHPFKVGYSTEINHDTGNDKPREETDSADWDVVLDAHEANAPNTGAWTRKSMIHSSMRVRDFLLSSPSEYRDAFDKVREAKDWRPLTAWLWNLTKAKMFTGVHVSILWDIYNGRKEQARRNLSVQAQKLLKAIETQKDGRSLGSLGRTLFDLQDKPRKGSQMVKQVEWSIIWKTYKEKKAVFQEERTAYQNAMDSIN